MEWWARIGVTKQYIMDNACSELFPELSTFGCSLKMFTIFLDFKPYVQILLAVLSEKETYLKSKFCDFHYDIFGILYEENRTDFDRCINAMSTINSIYYIDSNEKEVTSAIIMDFCQRINADCNNYNYVVKDIIPRVVRWFQRYMNSLDKLEFCGDYRTIDFTQQIEGKSSEDNNIEIDEMINKNLEYSEFVPSELEQPKTECDYMYGNGFETRCSSNEDCKQCSDCPEGVWCDLNFDFDSYGPFCQCDEIRNYNEYDNSMDDFNAKSEEVQSENEEKIIEVEELENSNLEYSEAAPSELEQPKKECGIKGSGSCSSQDDCKQCSDCPNGAECVAMGWIPMRGGNGECRCHGYIDCGMFGCDYD